MRNRYLYITILTLFGLSAETAAQTIAQPPQLVVTIAIDQLRTDRLETYAPLYQSGGLKRLLTEGLVYPNAACNFTPVDKSSAIASLMTGATPYYNGITGSEWMDRNTLRPLTIVSDNQRRLSPQQLSTSTLGDELKIATDGLAVPFCQPVMPPTAAYGSATASGISPRAISPRTSGCRGTPANIHPRRTSTGA